MFDLFPIRPAKLPFPTRTGPGGYPRIDMDAYRLQLARGRGCRCVTAAQMDDHRGPFCPQHRPWPADRARRAAD